MLIDSWIAAIRNRVANIAARNRRSRKGRSGLVPTSAEGLESRVLLTTVNWVSGTGALTVSLDEAGGGDPAEEKLIISTRSGGIVRLFVDDKKEPTAESLAISAGDVETIVINGNSVDNYIELHRILEGAYNPGVEVTINGAGGDDSLGGTLFSDVINGGAGNDVLLGLDGRDTLNGGIGDDTLDGSTGVDTLNGEAGADTIYSLENALHADSITNPDGTDTLLTVSLPGRGEQIMDPVSDQSIIRITDDFQENLSPDIVNEHGTSTQSVTEWGVAVYNRHWTNPAFNLSGDYIRLESNSLGTEVPVEQHDIIIDANSYEPVMTFRPQYKNFRWSQNPATQEKFYDITGNAITIGDIGDILDDDPNAITTYTLSGFSVTMSKGGIMYGTIDGYMLPNPQTSVLEQTGDREFAVAFENDFSDLLILDLTAVAGGATSRADVVVTEIDLAARSADKPQDDVYVAGDASFFALDFNLDAFGNANGNLDERSLLIKVGDVPTGVTTIDTEGLLWPLIISNVPDELKQIKPISGVEAERFSEGFTPLKFEHATTAFGEDGDVYFVGGITQGLVGEEITDTTGINYATDDPTVGTLVGINTDTGEFHLITSGVGPGGEIEATLNHVTGTQQNTGSGYVAASFNEHAGLQYSGQHVRIAIGVIDETTPQADRVSEVTLHRTATAGNTLQQGQPIPNLSPDGSKLLITSTWGVDLSDVDFTAYTATPPANDGPTLPGLVHSFVVEFPTTPAPPEITGPGTALSVNEGVFEIATVTAMDPNNEDFGLLEFSISGGADSSQFSIDPDSGSLRFISEPDFENPTDVFGVAGDNIYEVTVTVTDPQLTTDSRTFQVTVNDIDDVPHFDVDITDGVLTVFEDTASSNTTTLDFTIDGGGQEHLIFTSTTGDSIDEIIDSSITQIVIDLGQGDDSLTVVKRSQQNTPTFIIGGSGNDIIDAAFSDPTPGGVGFELFGAAGSDTLYGTAGPDTLTGSSGNDVLIGGAGDDQITAGSGKDTIRGGAGDDSLRAGAGSDAVFGDEGSDTIRGEASSDHLEGGDGNDEITGGPAGDTIRGNAGDDTLNGQSGTDSISGGNGNDSLNGDFGSDLIEGDAGNDTVHGDQGNDTLVAGTGTDSLSGGEDDDNLSGTDGDTLEGGNGTDSTNFVRFIYETQGTELTIIDTRPTGLGTTATFDVTSTADGQTISFATNDATTGNELIEKFIEFIDTETDPDKHIAVSVTDITIELGDGDDVVTINERPVELVNVDFFGSGGNDNLNASLVTSTGAGFLLHGGSGNDTVTGGSGDDLIYGGTNHDSISGGSGNDTVNGNIGNDTVHGDAGDDVITGAGGMDELYGGSGNDTLSGHSGTDSLFGEDGDDSLSGDASGDSLAGGAGDDTLRGDVGNDSIEGNDGNDSITGGSGGDSILGGNDDDTISGESGQDTIDGQEGDDSIDGGGDDDLIVGAAGNDYMDGGDGNDSIHGNDGDDTMIGGIGNDWLNGNMGNDSAEGGDGNDTLLGGGGHDVLLGQDGDDTISGNGGIDTMEGGLGNDKIDGSFAIDSKIG